jgi:hypothetical protein
MVMSGGDGIPYQHLLPLFAEEEYEAMAAAGEPEAVVVEVQGEAPRRDAIGGLQGRFEAEVVQTHVEETEEGRVAEVA